MKIKEIEKNTDTKSRVTYLNLKKGVRMFGKKIEIGEGQKYDVTKVSTESVNQEEVAKKNAKLIEIFKRFDISKDGKLDSTEMAMAMDYFSSLDESGDDKISKKEFQEAAEAFNEEMQLTGKDKVDAKDLKTFIKNLFSATKNDPTEETQKLLSQYLKEQQNIQLEEKQRLIDDDAKRRGWEWSQDGAYWDKEDNKYYLPNAEGTEFVEVHWSDSEQRFKVMSAEELAELNAALEKQRAQQEAADEEAKNKTYGYVVQSGDKFTEVMTKVLQAQGIENPTEEQIAEAKEQFKKDNPNAIRTTSSGYEFLMVGEQVKLRGEVEYAKNSQEAVAQWAQDNPDLVWKPKTEKVQEEAAEEEAEEVQQRANGDLTPDEKAQADKAAQEAGYRKTNCIGIYYDDANKQHYKYNPETGQLEKLDATTVNPNGTYFLEETTEDGTVTKYYDKNGNEVTEEEYNKLSQEKTLEERAKDVKKASDSIMPDTTALTNKAKAIEEAKTQAAQATKELEEILSHDWIGDGDFIKAMKDKTKYNKDTMAYIVYGIEGSIAEKIDNMFGLDEEDVYNYIIIPLREKSKELGLNVTDVTEDSSLQEMQDAIALMAANIKAVEEETTEAAEGAKKINENKELFVKSNNSLARVVDMAENNPDSVTRGTTEKGSEYCSLEDGTEIFIKRDKEGNIISVQIYNPGGPDNHYDISYNASGTVFFDPDGKYTGSGGYKEKIEDAPFDFDKIKALAERIFGAKPKAAAEE